MTAQVLDAIRRYNAAADALTAEGHVRTHSAGVTGQRVLLAWLPAMNVSHQGDTA